MFVLASLEGKRKKMERKSKTRTHKGNKNKKEKGW